jgi:uncharacterized protein (DUF983 family)
LQNYLFFLFALLCFSSFVFCCNFVALLLKISTMQFVYPAFLWASLLVALPIVIHLFNFQRAKKVYFTNIAFLKEIKSVSSAQNKLRHLLVLLMRCLAVLALVFAFAQPYLPANQALTNNLHSNHVSIYTDNSFSMQAEKGNKKLLDLSLQYTDQIVKIFPKNAVFQLLNNNFEESMNYFAEKKKVEEAIYKITYSPASRQLKNVYERQQKALQTHSNSQKNYIFWISDFQKNMFQQFATQALDSNNVFYLVPQQAETASNIYIDSVWLENPFIKVGENNTLFAKINNVGTVAVRERAAKLFIDGKQVSNGTINAEENSHAILKMNFAVQAAGAKHCKISIEDSPILFDNDFFFTLTVAPTIRLVHIWEKEEKFIQQVYSQESFFNLQSFNVQAIDYNVLQNANLVILQDLPQIDEALGAALQKFLANGGNLVLFPHENFDALSYTNLLGTTAQHANKEKYQLLPPDSKNPFYANIFEKVSAQMNMPLALQSLVLNMSGQTLLKFKDETPFLKIISNDRKKLFVFASPLNKNASELGKHALFVPLMYKIALQAHDRKTEKLAYYFDENRAEIAINDSSLNKNDIFKILNQASKAEFIPIQRITDNKVLIEIPKATIQAGNYQIIRKADNKDCGAIALNYSKTESNFSAYTSQELKALFKHKTNVQVFEKTEIESFATSFQEKNIAKPLWFHCIVAVLVCLLAEILLLRFFKK